MKHGSDSHAPLPSLGIETWPNLVVTHAGPAGAWHRCSLETLHTIYYEQEAATLLGIPAHIHQAVLLPVAYYTGEDFKPAKRLPVRDRMYWDTWGQTR